MPEIDFNKEVENGFTVEDIINDIAIELDSIMSGTSFRDPFTSREDLNRYIGKNLLCYTDKDTPEVYNYFNWKYHL